MSNAERQHPPDVHSLGVEPVYSYADLKRLGEGSRFTIDRRVKANKFPPPDYYDAGRFPRWLASTIAKHRQRLIDQHREAQRA